MVFHAFALPLFEFWDALNLVMLAIIFVLLYRVTISMTTSPLIGLLLATLIFFLLAIPYDWLRVFLFITLLLYQGFSKIKPWEW